MTTQTKRSGTFREDESRAQSPELRKPPKDRDEDIAVGSETVSVSEYLDKWLKAVEDTVRPGTLCSWFL
jgi:hypothetical protein